jgi:ABC-type Fe3+ transport system permease subunit
MLPMAVPGLVLGLGYIFFFNAPNNPLNGLYHTLDAAHHLHHRALLHHRPPDLR